MSAFLLAGALQQLQVVGEGVEGNAEEELQLLRWAGPIVPELPREFTSRGFLFLYFLFLFFTKIYFRFENLQKYTPAAPLPGGRDLAARNIPRPPRCRAAGIWLPGGRGLSAKKEEKNCGQVLGNRPPGSRVAGLPGRPAWGAAGPPTPYIRVLAAPPPSFALLKIQKKEKRGREGEEG